MALSSYLVTGGAGFVGSYLVRFLLERGERVRVLDDFSTGKRENLDEVSGSIEIIEGNVCNQADVSEAIDGVDFVLHEAAIASVPRSVEAPLESHEANATGTLVVLEAARAAAIQRVVYASSSSVYGESAELPKREAMPTAPLSPYAVSKLAAEHYCTAYHRVYGLPTVSLRYFNIFGPRQDPAKDDWFITGTHRDEGLLAAWGRGVRRGERFDGVTLYDIAPTVLHELGLPVARDMPGRVLEDLFEDRFARDIRFVEAYTHDAEAGAGMSEPVKAVDDEAERRRLRALGYID